jgi:hypothetical protein
VLRNNSPVRLLSHCKTEQGLAGGHQCIGGLPDRCGFGLGSDGHRTRLSLASAATTELPASAPKALANGRMTTDLCFISPTSQFTGASLYVNAPVVQSNWGAS